MYVGAGPSGGGVGGARARCAPPPPPPPDPLLAVSVRIDDSKKDHIKIQDVRVGQKKEDLSSVGDYNLNCACSPKGCPPFNNSNF